MGVDPQKEKFCFDEYNPEELRKVISDQFKIAEFQKKRGRSVFNVLCVIDDMADNPSFTRESKLLHQLYIRGRHAFISVITSVQKTTTLAPLIRSQATHIFTFRLRSMQDLELWLNENSAIYPKKTLLKIYEAAVSQPFGFLYMDMTAQKPEDMFFSQLSGKIRVNE